MSSWLNETQMVHALAQNLLAAKKSRYQEDMIRLAAIKAHRLNYKTQLIKNIFGEHLCSTVFFPLTEQAQCCIVYLHGYGSHRLEGLSLLSSLPKEIGLCCFDFSGSGKSEGNSSTYGMKESLDIETIIKMLKQEYGFKKIVLWGRSMGAVASILYTSKSTDRDVFFQVLDSPFSSFQAISLHHAKNIIGLPELFLNFGVGIVKEHLKSSRFNPYNMNMCQSIRSCRIPTLFIFCEQDQIIPAENSHRIIENYPKQGIYEKLIIEEDHNTFRSSETISNILSRVKRYIGCEKIKQKTKHKKGFNQIMSSKSKTPTASEKSRKCFGRIDCSLSRRSRFNPQNFQKKASLPCYIGLLSAESPTEKN